MRRKIILYGSLKHYAPDGLELEANTVYEAVNGMCKVLGIKVDIIRGRTPVKILGFDTLESVVEPSDVVELHIVPAFQGAKGGILQMVVGAILITLSIVFSEFLGPFAAPIFGLGLSLLVGGLINVLFPVKVADKTTNYLGAPGNTTQIGTRIPLIFGRSVQVFGQFLSYNTVAVAK